MKNIIKTAICLIVISSILLYSSISEAATPQTLTLTIAPSGYKPTLISSDVWTDETTGTVYNYFTYQFTITPYVGSSNDTYKNGYYTIQLTVDNLTPTGGTLTGIVFDYETIMTEQVVSFGSNPVQNGGRTFRIVNALYNYGYYLPLPLNEITCTVTFRISGLQWSNFTISPTLTSSFYSSNVTADATPQSIGFQAIIKQAITEALQVGELNLVYDYLVFWKTTQDGYLADIDLSVDDVEMWLSYINSAQASLQNKIDLIYTLEQTFPGYFNTMIAVLQQIRDMNASDTAAESQMQNAEQQLSQAVNDMEVQKPNINNVVNAGDQYMDSNITGAQGDTFFWLHGTNIFVTILTMAVTIGILGFVIYGKSG